MTQKDKPIAFQGEMGANSHIACNDIFPDREVLPCTTFEGAFKAVENGSAALAVLPVENTVAGRVADIHRLLPGYDLYIIGEYFMRIDRRISTRSSARSHCPWRAWKAASGRATCASIAPS